jgi:hypothetical protein
MGVTQKYRGPILNVVKNKQMKRGGLLECWNVGMLECWNVGSFALECWIVGTLKGWIVDTLNGFYSDFVFPAGELMKQPAIEVREVPFGKDKDWASCRAIKSDILQRWHSNAPTRSFQRSHAPTFQREASNTPT